MTIQVSNSNNSFGIIPNRYKYLVDTKYQWNQDDLNIIFGYTKHFRNNLYVPELFELTNDIVFTTGLHIGREFLNLTKPVKKATINYEDKINKLLKSLIGQKSKRLLKNLENILLEKYGMPRSYIQSLFYIPSDTIRGHLKDMIFIAVMSNLDQFIKQYPRYFKDIVSLRKVISFLFAKLNKEYYEGKPDYYLIKLIRKVTSENYKNIIYTQYINQVNLASTLVTSIANLAIKNITDSIDKYIIEYNKLFGKKDKNTKNISDKEKKETIKQLVKGNNDKNSNENNNEDNDKNDPVLKKDEIITESMLQEQAKKQKQKIISFLEFLERIKKRGDELITHPEVLENENDDIELVHFKRPGVLELYTITPHIDKDPLILIEIQEYNTKGANISIQINSGSSYIKDDYYLLNPHIKVGWTDWDYLKMQIKDILSKDRTRLVLELLEDGVLVEKSIEIEPMGMDLNKVNNEEFLKKFGNKINIDWNKAPIWHHPILQKVKDGHADTLYEVNQLLNTYVEFGDITEDEKEIILRDLVSQAIPQEQKLYFFNIKNFKNSIGKFFKVRNIAVTPTALIAQVSKAIDLSSRKSEDKVLEAKTNISKMVNLLGRFNSMEYELNFYKITNGKQKQKIMSYNSREPLTIMVLDIQRLLEIAQRDDVNQITISGKLFFPVKELI